MSCAVTEKEETGGGRQKHRSLKLLPVQGETDKQIGSIYLGISDIVAAMPHK